MFNRNNTKNKGFTLIELLIVIAIIGVLAATVVVSLGDKTTTARKETVKIGVSSVRSLATAEVASPSTGIALSGDALCDNIYPNVSADKSSWAWDGAATCTNRKQLTGASATDGAVGEICCSASAGTWVIWGAIEGSGGTGNADTDIYCADSTGFLGEVAVAAVDSTGASIKSGTGTPTSCE